MNTKEILKQLVAFPVLGGQSNLSIAEWIESYLNAHDIKYFNVPNEDGNKRSIHCRIGPPVDGGIILSGHMDVVPVEGQDWTTDPFKLVEKNDKLYARGSCDMKGFLACCLSNISKMKKANLKKPFYFVFSYDEEIGCLAAPALIKHIKQSYDEKPKYAIIGEPSMMQIVTGQKGIVIYNTTVNGSAGHSSRIKTEVSAIHETARLICWLEDQMNLLLKAGKTDHRFDPPFTSIHCGTFEKSGIAPNVISDYAHFQWDVRSIPGTSGADIKEAFEVFCNKRKDELKDRFPNFKIEIKETHPEVPSLSTSNDAQIIKILQSINQRQDLGAVSYAAEAGQFSDAGFETVICGPGDIAQAHRADEYISLEQLDEGDKMIQKLIEFSATS